MGRMGGKGNGGGGSGTDGRQNYGRFFTKQGGKGEGWDGGAKKENVVQKIKR